MLRPALLLAVLTTACGDERAQPVATPSRLQPVVPGATAGPITVTGSVIDRDTREAVAGVEVVLHGLAGDTTVKTDSAGGFTVTVPRGRYRAFVRDARVMTAVATVRQRLKSLPDPELVGALDEGLLPVLDVDGPIANLELGVTVGAVITGVVLAADGTPVRDAVVRAAESDFAALQRAGGPRAAVRARLAERPVLGTDIAVTGARGEFSLRVPAGDYQLVANHPSFANLSSATEIHVAAGDRSENELQLVRGCIITGKVTAADGTPVHDGAIETTALDPSQFVPTGRVRSDGTFRWTTTETGTVSIRAWPWQQPAAAARAFECRDGKRYSDVVLTLPVAAPDIAGTLVDAHGAPVPLAYLDVASIDVDITGQQERADAAGQWAVFAMPPGRYQITAAASGRGIVRETITAPRRDVHLRLSGTGRIAGTTTDLVDGSFEMTFHHCGVPGEQLELDDPPRLVIVRGGRFVVDGAPACTLGISARWRDSFVPQTVVVEPDRTSYIELALGARRPKLVHGRVRDEDGEPARNARVTAVLDNTELTTVRTNDQGLFEIKTLGGAELMAGNGKRVGRGQVGLANVPDEQVDIRLDTTSY